MPTLPPPGETKETDAWEPYGTSPDPAHDLPTLWTGENGRWVVLTVLCAVLVAMALMGVNPSQWWLYGPVALSAVVVALRRVR
jgi:hypothetical protein